MHPTSHAATAPADFGATFASVEHVAGWMTRAQAARLWDRAAERRPGERIVEIGSFRGRSAIVLASAAPEGVEVVAIDPHGGNDRGPQELRGYEAEAQADHEAFLANLTRAGVRHRVRHLRRFAQDALGELDGPVHLLYVDGAHRFGPARADVVRWGARVPDRGVLLVHDAFSSVGVTLALLTSVAVGRRFRYVGRSGSLVEYRRDDLAPPERVVNLARHLAELPWFVRNLAIKALVVARLGRLSRLLGGDGGWPY